MDTYTEIAYQHSRSLTLHYSSSFGLSSRLFSRTIRRHIYAVYGLVRIADEIVDTYLGKDARELLDSLEAETYAAIERYYSTNPIVHASALTAAAYTIDRSLIAPFFASMRMDLLPATYDAALYQEYIHGSAEVVGLMCLRIFCEGDHVQFHTLEPGAAALGSAYQKVNFLRDMAADHRELGRLYFPNVRYETFSEADKTAVVADIEADFARALPAISQLPPNSREAVMTSYLYYSELLAKLKAVTVEDIKSSRLRIPKGRKLQIFAAAAARHALKK